MWRIRSLLGPVCWRREVDLARPVSSQPTEVELQILRILWQTGGATARQVHNGLAAVEAKSTNYSTTVKMLSVMLDKGLVKRDETATPQVFPPPPAAKKRSGHAPRPD